MSSLGIQNAATRVSALSGYREDIRRRESYLRANPTDFPCLLDLVIADITAMGFGKDMGSVYECMQEDISNIANLEECSKMLLDFYENGITAVDHVMVEDSICHYLKMKGFAIIETCKARIGATAQGRPIAELQEAELASVMEQQSIILKVTPPGITKRMRDSITKSAQEVLRANAFVPITESGELNALNTEIGKFQIAAEVKSLDVLLTEAKDYLCQMEREAFSLGDISRYLGIVRFLMTTLSTHTVMIKKERDESVARLQTAANIIEGMYKTHGCFLSACIKERILRLTEAKEMEILSTGRALTKDPLERKQQSANDELRDYEDTIAAYEEHQQVVVDNIASLKEILQNACDPHVTCESVVKSLSDYFIEEGLLCEEDPLLARLQSITADLQTQASLGGAVDPASINAIIDALLDFNKCLHRDHLEALIIEYLPLVEQKSAAAVVDDENAGMRALLEQLSLI